MLFLLFGCVFPSLAFRGLHLGTGRVVQWDDSFTSPSPVERLRLTVTKTKAEGAKFPVTIHILRLRWTAPHTWNDDGNEEQRMFAVVCEAEGGKDESNSLMDISISADITAIHERFVFPDISMSIICAVRAINAQERKSSWKYSKLILLGTDLMMKEKKEATNSSAPVNEQTDGSLVANQETKQSDELKKLLAESNIVEDPFLTTWEKRPDLYLTTNGTKTAEEEQSNSTFLETSSISPTTSLEYRLDNFVNEPDPTTEAATTTSSGTLEDPEERMNLLHEAVQSLPQENNKSKADQIIRRESDLFLRGLILKVSELPEEESREEVVQLGLPFQTEVFDNEEVLRLSPSGLSEKEKEDYELLEARLREAVGPHFDRVL